MEMPSEAFSKFEQFMLKDVDALIDLHSDSSGQGRGRRGLGHLTRGGVLSLCAAWELYVEELVVECAKKLVESAPDVHALPKDTKKTLSSYVKDHKHQLKALELSGDGWKSLLVAYAQQEAGDLNTPKTAPIDDMFRRIIGLPNLSSSWTVSGVDDFVSARGDVAHKGSQAAYITIGNLKSYRATVSQLVLESDNAIPDYFRSLGLSSPWRKRRPA